MIAASGTSEAAVLVRGWTRDSRLLQTEERAMAGEAFEASMEGERVVPELARLQIHVHVHLGDLRRESGPVQRHVASAAEPSGARSSRARLATAALVLCGLGLLVGWLATRPVGPKGGDVIVERAASAGLPSPSAAGGSARPVVAGPAEAATEMSRAPGSSGAASRPAPKSGPAAFGLSD